MLKLVFKDRFFIVSNPDFPPFLLYFRNKSPDIDVLIKRTEIRTLLSTIYGENRDLFMMLA